jgi:hypothetical protein
VPAAISVETFSTPWRMADKTMFMIELDSTDRGSGILAAIPVIQRASIPTSAQFPTSTGVNWQDVPAADIVPGAFVAIAAENIQIVEVTNRVSYTYRLRISTVTATGDLWAAVVIK